MALSSTTYAWQHPGPIPDSNLLLKETFQEGVEVFVSKLTEDEDKRNWINSKHDIADVLKVTNEAKLRYDGKGDSKAFEWLSKFAYRVQYYGVIMDTMSQHHPEYVSLVWGAIKFCFIGILNREELVAQLSKALVQIADALPRAALKLVLYPTETMRHAVAMIYARVIKFLIRALNWYSEGRLKHVYHSFTQPFSLRYIDILEDIQSCSRTIESIAADAAQAEMRDMHILIRELKKIAVDHQSLTSSGFINTNRQLCELQFSEILTFVASTPVLQSPEHALCYHLAMKKRRRYRRLSSLARPQKHAQLQAWGSVNQSSLIIIRGDFATRNLSRDLAVSIIEAIKLTSIPVVWVLNSRNTEETQKENVEAAQNLPTTIDVLKQLVLQVLQHNHTHLNESSAALDIARYKSTTTEREWFDLLGSAISGLPQLYIVIDVEVVGPNSGDTCKWPESFARLFEALVSKSASSTVKVVLVSYRTRVSRDIPGQGSAAMLDLGNKGRTLRSSKVAKPRKLLKAVKRRCFDMNPTVAAE